jgi:hypothetical protein
MTRKKKMKQLTLSENQIKTNISHFLFIILYTGCKIFASLGYVTVKGEGKMERAREEQDALCAVASPPSLPPSLYLGWLQSPRCVFIMVSEARRYLATSILDIRNLIDTLIFVLCSTELCLQQKNFFH